MPWNLFLGILLTILPISELRGGLPLIVKYCLDNNVSIIPYFLLVVILNSLVAFALFLFMDYGHSYFMNFPFYEKIMTRYINKIRKKEKKLESSLHNIGFISLLVFVAIPVPGTGAWTGTILAWLLNLNRVRSLVAITLGVLIAGIIVLGLSMGFFSLF